jgi:uncharacterized membrane protein
MRISKIISILIIAASFAVSIYFYPLLPAKIASHWNAQGQVNGYMDKFWGLFLMPAISVLLLLLFLAIPKIDPLKENIAQFRKHFDWFIVLIISFLFYIHLLSILWNMGIIFDFTRALVPALGILIYSIGIIMENAKRNWFIGIRTPWTLSNEKVWDKTHKLGGTLFKISGIISLLGLFFPKIAIILLIAPIITTVVIAVVYSYFAFRGENSTFKKID